jgi:hypothetical protein
LRLHFVVCTPLDTYTSRYGLGEGFKVGIKLEPP